ncbi:MAG: GNAT family N-acetyltransferase [Trueperaceae bacterium]|nr:GNAT family N-acetyltransferase [Trueperaceae bacterium]
MPEKPTLRGKTVILRPIGPEDAEAMYASLSDKEAMQLTGTKQSFSLEQVQAFCARVPTEEDRYDFAITLPGENRYRGEVVLNDIDWDNRSSNFRIAISGTENREKGYGSEATELVLEFGFKTLNLHRIELEVYDFNPRAQHVYKKHGFIQEGIRRDVLLWEGKFQSAIVMSLLQPDYLARQSRARFESLETPRLRMRRLRDDDLAPLVAYRNLPEVAWMQLWENYDTESAKKLINGCKVVEPFTANDSFQFAVALKESDELIGDLYFKMDEAGKQAEIGYTFDPRFQGKGLATEAVKTLINHAFKEQGLHRIYGITDPRNAPSINLMKRLGMKQEAQLRKSLWFKGEWADDVIFAVLAEEWKTF